MIVALALGLGADALSLGDRGGALGEIFRGRRDVGIPEQAERNAPIGDAAFGIGLQHVLECVLRRAVPERVLIQHSAVEKLLRLRLARCFEMDLAELLVVDCASAAAPAKGRSKASAAIARDVLIALLPLAVRIKQRVRIARRNGNADLPTRLGRQRPEVISEKRDFYGRLVLAFERRRKPCRIGHLRSDAIGLSRAAD